MNSLGIDKLPQDTRVVVAMSGGVDSSVVAAMLHAEGYQVIGITLQLYDYGVAVGKKGACCAGQDIADARRVADTLGVPHYVLNYEDKFKESVMDDFVETYLAGATPIPCVRCNQTVKFRDLLETAHDLGADCMATGHYVQRALNANGHAQLLRGEDKQKDQSYFLFATTKEQLNFLRFPLGGMNKEQTRALAEKYNLAVADKPDSQDICFVPGGDYAAVIKKMRPTAEQPGDIIHIDGTVLGKHAGIIHYTVGQRRGLDIGGMEEPIYVVKLDVVHNRVIVGPKDALNVQRFPITDVNWLMGNGALPATTDDLWVKMRSQMQPVPAHIEHDRHKTEVVLHHPQQGIAPGQACVAYDGDRVLGGGWISANAG